MACDAGSGEEPNCLAVRGPSLAQLSCSKSAGNRLPFTSSISMEGGWGVEVRWGRRQGNVFSNVCIFSSFKKKKFFFILIC